MKMLVALLVLMTAPALAQSDDITAPPNAPPSDTTRSDTIASDTVAPDTIAADLTYTVPGTDLDLTPAPGQDPDGNLKLSPELDGPAPAVELDIPLN